MNDEDLAGESFDFLFGSLPRLLLGLDLFLQGSKQIFLLLRKELILVLDMALVVLFDLGEEGADDQILPADDFRPNFGADSDALAGGLVGEVAGKGLVQL